MKKIAVFGTGSVGQTLAGALARLSYNVTIGTRDVEQSLARAKNDANATPSISDFLKENPTILIEQYANAARDAEIIVLCTAGNASKDVLISAGNIDGKIVLDITNPLDFGNGFPPSLFVSNTSSLGEVLQETFPKAHIVKSLNTMATALMVDPRALGEDSTVFLSGNNTPSKETIKSLLKQFGWKENEILDLGDITTARGTESLLPVWLRIYASTKSGFFNFKIATGK